uniref:ATP synthase F(0) complex subunit e, mitochondrial n=1 Tax=Oryctolagus cuniculus TaxID=9986 RepID=A0A5F9C6V8_RABIT
MVPPVHVSPFIKLGRYSALFLGAAQESGDTVSYLKPCAEEERRLAAAGKQKQDELKPISRERAEGTAAAPRGPGVVAQGGWPASGGWEGHPNCSLFAAAEDDSILK